MADFDAQRAKIAKTKAGEWVLVSGASNRPLRRQVVCIQQRSLEGSVDYPTPAVTGCLIDPGWRLMTSFDCSALTT
ncbi:hypothetical protein ASC97_28330 [Rhizobium sp. Root1203]|uniref:hypothetical protein n=1 Tax=Rhizobium sp. Root1203 TaxID=1736427 RepID=UPI000710D3DE|nr:hypothetical protein [Rhizobium sp. Root1203]KQV21209.1 hypothetical protein ASC97_28330 [Rhizobium sp. Root1203]